MPDLRGSHAFGCFLAQNSAFYTLHHVKFRAQYVVVQPGALPQRPGDTGPNIVEYALATTHPPGVQMHTRRSLVRKDPLVACARFTSPDLAQEEFLRSGGPERDRLGLDPDGDGFACDWDPRPFRTALN